MPPEVPYNPAQSFDPTKPVEISNDGSRADDENLADLDAAKERLAGLADCAKADPGAPF
jgi:hypothetical protein